MESVGIRELKQNASEVVSRVERGETIRITVQGRPVAQLSPIGGAGPQRWVSGAVLNEALAELGPDTTGWLEELEESRKNDVLENPWERNAP